TTTTTNFGLIECSWPAAYTLTVPTTWTTGNYIAKLRRTDSGMESYMTFVVRDDAGAADIVLSMDVTTWQAYNFWGGSGNSNIGYYQVRWQASASGQPYRRVVCYKDQTLDPTTIRWRDLTPAQPENALLGVMQNGVASDRAYRVYDATSWIYAGTGLVNYVSG